MTPSPNPAPSYSGLPTPASGFSIDAITSAVWVHPPTHPPPFLLSLQPGFFKGLSTLSVYTLYFMFAPQFITMRLLLSLLYFPPLTLKNNGLPAASSRAHSPIFALWPSFIVGHSLSFLSFQGLTSPLTIPSSFFFSASSLNVGVLHCSILSLLLSSLYLLYLEQINQDWHPQPSSSH